MLTRQQKLALAGTLACTSTAVVKEKLKQSGLPKEVITDAMQWIASIEKHYVKRDGFVPKAVLNLINWP